MSRPEISLDVNEALDISDEVSVLTSGISMRPMLRQHRDLAVIVRPKTSLKKYDVALYRRDNCSSLVLHRILKIRENDYVIRGDNTYSLEYVPKNYVVGVLKCFYRDGKYIDCNTNKKYRAYIYCNQLNYPFRYAWRFLLRPALSKVKHFIIK